MRNENADTDFTPIQEHIRRANLERSVYVGNLVAEGGAALMRSLKRIGAAMQHGYAEELDRRAIEADAFLRRSVPKY